MKSICGATPVKLSRGGAQHGHTSVLSRCDVARLISMLLWNLIRHEKTNLTTFNNRDPSQPDSTP